MLKIGDFVIGNEGADAYGITRKGVKCQITAIEGLDIEVIALGRESTGKHWVRKVRFDPFHGTTKREPKYKKNLPKWF